MQPIGYYKPGEVIVRENDPGHTAYIIEQGQVAVTKMVDGRLIQLAILGVEEAFGEMSMIDDKPRSATVTAIEPTVVRQITREGFFHALQTDPKMILGLLKVLFERLREADARIVQLHRIITDQVGAEAVPLLGVGSKNEVVVFLQGLTPHAARALPTTPLPVTKFPFRIGQESEDPLAYNDLMLPDVVPPQLSQHHVAIINYEGHIGVIDRRSHLGALVDGKPLGGAHGSPDPLFFTGDEGLLVLGAADSPFRYSVMIRRPKA
jgi:CRP-like cAMP-binding protein